MSGRTLKRLLAILGVMVIGLLAAAVKLGFQAQDAYRGDADRREAMAVSGRVITNMYSIRYETVDRDIQRLLADFTSRAKDTLAQGGAQLKEQVTKNKAVSQANVRGVGVVEMDDDSAEVLVAVDRTATSSKVKNGQVNPFRWQVSLIKVGGRWQVSNLFQVP